VTRVELPQLHAGQDTVYNGRKRFNVLQCGRRWGKTTFGEVLLSLSAIDGQPAAWFAPTYKYLQDVWRDVNRDLAPIIAQRSEQEKRLALTTGGTIDFWTLDTPDAGRGRKYKRAVLDECGIVRGLLDTWQQSIRPTLTDLKGDAWFLGTPKGRREFHTLYARGEAQEPGWAAFRNPTRSNPCIDPEEIEAARRELPEHVFKQEYEGIPADDGGNPFGMDSIAACLGPLSDAEPVLWGVDLAKSMDWTVALAMDAEGRTCRLERWQHVPWSETTRRLADLIGATPALADSTGVGDPIVEGLQLLLPNVEGFKFTRTSKQQLMEGLASAIQQRHITYPEGPVRVELEVFEYEFTPTGVRYCAPEGMHDDCVVALALANRLRTLHVPVTAGVVGAAADAPVYEDMDWRARREADPNFGFKEEDE
jgi:hypothetical protein